MGHQDRSLRFAECKRPAAAVTGDTDLPLSPGPDRHGDLDPRTLLPPRKRRGGGPSHPARQDDRTVGTAGDVILDANAEPVR